MIKCVRKKMMKTRRLVLAITLLLCVAIFAMNARGDPAGATITFNSTTNGPTNTPDNRSNAGGTITTVSLNAVQQDGQWKAYVGNISGALTLDDTAGNTIYQWNLVASSISGEIFASRASSVTWGNINCSSNALITTEESALGISGSTADSIRYTFNETTHPVIVTAGRTIPANSCNSTATFVNDTKQPIGSAYFPLILMADGTNNIYTTIINQDIIGFDSTRSFDFQMIVADTPTAANTTYYFYAEIG
jgi:hypothetical protein